MLLAFKPILVQCVLADAKSTKKDTQKIKGLNLNNVIAFLKEQGADENMIRLMEAQYSSREIKTTDASNGLPAIQDAKEKQSVSERADASQPIQESVNGNSVRISGFQQSHVLNHHPKDPAVVDTAT